ncbi:MAG: hypothetical protein WDW36_009647 [Sanguina aurantia]
MHFSTARQSSCGSKAHLQHTSRCKAATPSRPWAGPTSFISPQHASGITPRVRSAACGPTASVPATQAPSLRTAAVKRWRPSGPLDPDAINSPSQLVGLGFTRQQANQLLSSPVFKSCAVNLGNVRQWIELLGHLGIPASHNVLATHPIVLKSRADNNAANAAAVVQWIRSRVPSQAAVRVVICKFPKLLTTPCEKLDAATAWMRTELGSSEGDIHRGLARLPQLFAMRSGTLASKLAWFDSQAFDVARIRRYVLSHPQLLVMTTEHYEAQLAALQALGLSQSEALEMAKKVPVLLSLDIAGSNMQLKVRFLVRVMGLPVAALVRDPNFLSRSLMNTIGPRWAFSRLYSTLKPPNHTSHLSKSPGRYLETVKSALLEEECAERGLSPLQLFEEFIPCWQQGEGRVWAKAPKTSSAVLGGDSVGDVDEEADSDVGESADANDL